MRNKFLNLLDYINTITVGLFCITLCGFFISIGYMLFVDNVSTFYSWRIIHSTLFLASSAFAAAHFLTKDAYKMSRQ